MTTASFFRRGEALCGFLVQGHSGYAQAGYDIVCSAISACTHMTALGLTEILGLKARIDHADGRMSLILCSGDVAAAQPMLRALERELLEMNRQYPEHISITYRERREFKCFN